METVSDGKSARKSTGGYEPWRSTRWTANALIKDQVTPMLFRKHIVSTRTLLQLTVATVFFVGGVGAALAAGVTNTGTSTTAPLLVPYTVYTIAGTPQYATGTTAVVAGFGGEGGAATTSPTHLPGTAAYLDAPVAQAVDSVGNVYITDTGNNIIREVNAQTGLITTIAGVIPKNCSGLTCTVRTSGCADGVPAAGNPIGSSLQGIAVDAYGNVYFADQTTASVSVIYRGGTQVANFITLVNPGGVATSGGKVLPGYVYHVAGTVNLTSCAATLGTPGPDNSFAFENSANPPTTTGYPGGQLHSPGFVTLDGAGNIYIADTSNSTVRVVNTQATPQTFFQYTVQPGYMKSITDCNSALTTPCPTSTTTSTANTGINGPVNAIVFQSQYREAEVDAYGNIYQLNGTGSGTGAPGIYSATAYAGGAPLTNLLTVEAPLLASSFGPTATPPNAPAELPLTYGNSYISIGNPAISSTLPGSFPDVLAVTNEDLDLRPSSLLPDVFGTFWFNDNHYPEVERIDQYTGLATDVIGSQSQRATASVSGLGITNYNQPATFSNLWYCVYGASGNPWTQGPQTADPQGDGCPAIIALYSGGVHPTVSDGLGNIYLGDGGESLVRELPLGNVFPATAVGSATGVTQAIQVHFNSANPPKLDLPITDVVPGLASDPTTFTIGSGSDFTINITTPEFPMGALSSSAKSYANNKTTGNFAMYTGYPSCTQLGVQPIATTDTDYDCLVYVTFNPQAPGAREAQLTVTTANGGVYNFPLYGVGLGGQLAVDGGAPTTVPATGLKSAAAVAVSSANIAYIADPVGNQVVSCTLGTGGQCNVQGTIGTGLKGPMGVATDAAGNVYISDTGNNRILKVNPVTPTVETVLGNYAWIPGAICDGGSTTSPCPSGGLAKETGASVTATTAPPQYAFKAPQGLAVDVWNNVYVADTGNSAVVEIPSNPQLGGAAPLLSYSGAPQFKNPVGVAVDAYGNIYVADTKNPSAQIVKLPPGGGDLVNIPGTQFTTLGSGVKAPNGVAVDGAGNLYVSDSGANAVVEVPAGSGPGSTAFALNFPTIQTPGGLALDPSGNLYVADTGNKQILFDNRLNPSVSFGNVPQNLAAGAQPVCSGTILSDGFNTGNTSACVLTVTNIGSSVVNFAAPLLSSGGGNPAYNISNSSGSTACGATLATGLTCTLVTTFTPTADTTTSVTASVNAAAGYGTSPKLTLSANGQQPLANIVLSSSLGATPAAGGTDTIIATVTQPHIPGNTPTGTVTFTYVPDSFNANVNGCGTGGTVTAPLSGSGGTATANFNLPTLASGVTWDITANYNGDTSNSATQSTDLKIAVPGTPVTATVSSTAAQLTFIYGSAAPTPVGTVTPSPSPVTYTFGSAAKATTPTGSYNVVVSFSGAGSCAYGNPTPVFSSGGNAVVQENPATLTYTIPNFTAQFGAPNISFGAAAVVTGAQNGDGFGANFLIVNPSIPSGTTTSSTVGVGTYTVTPTVIGPNVGDYIYPSGKPVASTPAPSSTLTVTKAGTVISAALSPTSVLNTAVGVSTVSLGISVATSVPGGIGTPSGTVVVTDAFTQINATGTGTTTTTTTTLNLTSGAATYPPAGTTVSTAAGMHQYSFSYSGDTNFQASTLVPSSTAAACTPSALAANCLLVDYPDFTLTSTTGPVTIIPGVVPGGGTNNGGLLPAPNQSTAAPEVAVLFINQLLSFNGVVTLTCSPQNPSYVFCFMQPTTVCFQGAAAPAPGCTNTSKTAATAVAIYTPATLPLGFNTAGLRTSATRTVLAFLPLGVLAFCVRRRRRLSKALWMLMAISAIGAGMTGCGGNYVSFYTAVPTGPQTVTVNATWSGNASEPAGTRSFVVPINID